jgi:hypothetical protein
MKQYTRYFESVKYVLGDENVIVHSKLERGDVVPLYNWNTKKFIECRIIDIEEKDSNDSWKWFMINISLIDYVIYFTPTKRSKNIYKLPVLKDGKVLGDWKQTTTSDTYNSKSIKDFSRTYNR